MTRTHFVSLAKDPNDSVIPTMIPPPMDKTKVLIFFVAMSAFHGIHLRRSAGKHAFKFNPQTIENNLYQAIKINYAKVDISERCGACYEINRIGKPFFNSLQPA